MMKKILILICLSLIFLNVRVAIAQTCGTCNNADFVAGCDNGVTTCTSGDINCTFVGTGVAGALQDFPDIGNNPNFDTPIYCTDITTPTSINGSTSFGLGGISLLNTLGGPFGGPPQCGFPLAEITLFDASCSQIPANGGIDDVGLWNTWAEDQICCNTVYTICFQYIGVDCPNGASATDYLPEIYYIEEGENSANVPVIDFAATAVCDGDPINWTANGGCEGLTAGDDVVELYLWTGACAPVDPAAIPTCAGIDDIADVSTDLSLVGSNFTCASPPTTTGAWNALCNDPCDPRTMTFYAIARNLESDCDGDGTFDFRPGVDVAITRYDILVYPPQPITEVETLVTPVCSGATDVVIVEIGYDVDASGTLDGNEICGTKMADAPTNMTCDATTPTVEVTWTAAEISALTGAPTTLACYTPETDGDVVTVHPVAPTLTPATGSCGAAATLTVVSGAGATCDVITGTAPVEPACTFPGGNANDNQPIPAGTFTAADIETAFGLAASASCYVDIPYAEVTADCLSPECDIEVTVEVLDPCNCANPENIDCDGNDQISAVDLVQDVIQVTVNPPVVGDIWTVTGFSGSNIFTAADAASCGTTGLSNGTMLTDLGGGVYELVIYYPPGGAGFGTIDLSGISIPSSITGMPCLCLCQCDADGGKF